MGSYFPIIIGLGVTGISCARYLDSRGIPFSVVDTRTNPPNLDKFKKEFPLINVSCGKLDVDELCKASELIVSPGVSLQETAIRQAMNKGIKAVGDVELFCRVVTAPIVAITGSNGKSTLTTQIHQIALACGLGVAIGGNIGVPVLDLLTNKKKTDLYILELSSFQLETTFSLKAEIAALLNISPDHLDRYSSIEVYAEAKKRIFNNCKFAVFNKDDPLTFPNSKLKNYFSFSGKNPEGKSYVFGIVRDEQNREWLARGNDKLMLASDIPHLAMCYRLNALAAMAMSQALGFPLNIVKDTLRKFKGLKHRCQLVTIKDGVGWYNDSKATNVGATKASIEGLGKVCHGRIILLAGGVGKGADFSYLCEAVKLYVHSVITFGEDGNKLARAITGCASLYTVSNLKESVLLSKEISKKGDVVLLAPACASFDMFNNFEHRGDEFIKLVLSLV